MLPRRRSNRVRHTLPPLYVVLYGQHKLQLLVDTHIYTHTHSTCTNTHGKWISIPPFDLFGLFLSFFFHRYQIKLSRDGVEEGGGEYV